MDTDTVFNILTNSPFLVFAVKFTLILGQTFLHSDFRIKLFLNIY